MSSSDQPSLPHLAPLGAGPSGSSGLVYNAQLDAIVPAQPFTDAQVDEFREQDRWLPIANVARIMKNSLPTSAKVSKEAKECVQECVSEYISFIEVWEKDVPGPELISQTSEAADKCLNEKRKTINGEDILTSMRALGFDNYEGVLKIYLAKHREHSLIQARLKAQDEDSKRWMDGEEDGEGKKRRKKNGKRKDGA